MPALRGDRASRACDSCRKLKTRCYPSKDKRGTCLRCDTLDSPCSLAISRRDSSSHAANYAEHGPSSDAGDENIVPITHRLNSLEARLDAFITRVDSRLDVLIGKTADPVSENADSPETMSSTPAQDGAPVLLIRNAAADIGIGSPEQATTYKLAPDIISRGIVAVPDVYELLYLFQTHYGRWVAFDDTLSSQQLLSYIRQSPLLLCSICLVAVRQANHQLATDLAPILFDEAKRLLLTALLDFPQKIEFFQATLVLSLWSTTIGQIPLSLDSWLLSGYALQHVSANSIFTVFYSSESHTPKGLKDIRAQFVRTHLCLAHLQYCVGTRRKSILTQTQVDECAKVLEHQEVPQFETRMVAEVKLYWIIYTQCCASRVNLQNIRTSLSSWKRDWAVLFEQPRSQFLQMSHDFAILLAHCRSLQSRSTSMRGSTLTEMAQLARNIISVVIENTDERTSHLTDHIYHTITFSAIILSQLLRMYRGNLGGSKIETSLDQLIIQLVDWLRSIGFPCHVSRVLGETIAAYHGKGKSPGASRGTTMARHNAATRSDIHNSSVSPSFPPCGLSVPTAPTTPVVNDANIQDTRATMSAFDQDFSWTACFDFDAGSMEWPQYEESTDGGSGVFAMNT